MWESLTEGATICSLQAPDTSRDLFVGYILGKQTGQAGAILSF